MHRKANVATLMGLLFVGSLFAFGGDKAQVKGMINTRTGETLILQSGGQNVTVVLTDETKTKDDKGLFGLDKQYMSSTVLVPGLKVKVDGYTDDQGRVVAKTITVDGDDLETAEMVEAGLHPTAEQVAANVAKLEQHHGRLNAHEQDIAANKS